MATPLKVKGRSVSELPGRATEMDVAVGWSGLRRVILLETSSGCLRLYFQLNVIHPYSDGLDGPDYVKCPRCLNRVEAAMETLREKRIPFVLRFFEGSGICFARFNLCPGEQLEDGIRRALDLQVSHRLSVLR